MLDNMKPLLTIIVPAYNVEKYIRECLNSLVNQTVRNHKIVIINDGSTDNTEKICLEYQEKYSSLITYVYQDNQGLGEARNAGLRLVDTPYVTFLDSDDWFNIKYVECLQDYIDTTDELPDMIFTLPWIYDSVTKRVLPWKDKERYDHVFEAWNGISHVRTNSRICPELYALEVSSCRKIYNTAFLRANNFSFPKGVKWEDVPGHFYLLHKANTCVALPEIGFFYRMNQGAQITSGGGKSRLDMIPVFNQLLKLAKDNHFNSIENAYVFRLIVDFSRWSVDVTNMKYLPVLLKGLHEIFIQWNTKDITFYLNTCSPDKKLERGFITCLAGKHYMDLADYNRRYFVMQKYGIFRNLVSSTQNLFRGGVQCVREHGIRYTFIWCIKKYLLRKS